MSNRGRASAASNPFARAPPAADNPFASDDDEVLDEEEEDEADVMARESVRMVQERLKAEHKAGGGKAAAAGGGGKQHVKHTAPSFSDDEEEEDEEVVDDEEADEDEDDSAGQKKWVPDSSSPFARNVPAASKPAAGKAKPAKAKASKADASNPFAEHSKSKSKKGGGGGGSKAKTAKKEADADTNPFADPEPAPTKKAAPSSTTASPTSAGKDSKVESKTASVATSFLRRAAGAVGAAAVAAKTITTQAKPAAKDVTAAASPAPTSIAAVVAAAVSHKRQESNPFDADESDNQPPAAATPPTKARTAASTLVAPATSTPSSAKPAASPTPSPLTHPVSPPARSAASATSSSTLSASASHSAAAAPQSPPSLYIDSDGGDNDLSSLALPDKALASPKSAKREVAYQQRLQAAVGAGTKMQLSAFKEGWDAKVWTSELTQPLFALLREKYPMDEAEERKVEEEDEEEESDEDDDAADEEDGVSETERQAKKRQAQLKREGAGPRLRRRAFDPTPFNTLFSTSLTRLTTLRDSLDASITTANLATQKAEVEHTKRTSTFTTSLASLTSRFGQLDNRISSVSHTAVRIGSSLESINASKVNTVKTLDLLTHFIAFNTGNADTLAPLFTSQKLNDMYEAASVLQLLEGVSNEVRLVGVEKAVALIAKTSEECESRLLERFEIALERNNVTEMSSLARVLLGFRGKSVIKRYVFAAIQQIDRNRKRAADDDEVEDEREDDEEQEEDEEGDEDDDRANQASFSPRRRMTEEAPASPSVSAFRASLRLFYRIILTTIRQQCKTSALVFPQPASVVRAIVERVYSDQVTEFIDQAVGRGVSAEEELLILASALRQTERLTQQLQQLIKSVAASHSYSTVTSTSTPTSNASAMDVAALTDVLNGLFQKYRDAYIGKETAFLRSRCAALIHDTLASPPPATESITASLSSTASSAATDYLGMKRGAERLTARQRWLLDTLDSEVVDELLKAMLLSVKRCDALSEAQSLADNQLALFSVVLSALVDDFCHPLLEMAAHFLPAAEPKAEPDSFVFVCVRLASSVAYRIRQHYVTFIQPRLTAASATAGLSSQNTQAISEQRLSESLLAVESQLLGFLSRVLAAQLRIVQRLLSKQKLTDYKRSDEESLFSGTSTQTAAQIVDSLHTAYTAAVNNLEGRNLDQYLTVLGLKVWQAVVEQLQRMSVSEMGAGLLARDCKEYEQVVLQWHVREVVERFSVLRSLSSLFFVSVDNLQAWVEQEGRVRGMERDELMSFVKMRADYSANKTKIIAALSRARE